MRKTAMTLTTIGLLKVGFGCAEIQETDSELVNELENTSPVVEEPGAEQIVDEPNVVVVEEPVVESPQVEEAN